ncbi:hypothetical protein GCM10010129_37260 [Streptomyces fumigatiscleroticus]|nr:hypothetical protein GCM10010129_37260 [Streptomyces fumigatiscleroticus]
MFVPVPAARLDEVLDDPSRVARAVPGLQQDAGAEPVAGRLKVRVGSHSITYRGSVRVSRRDDGSHTAEGTATEARGTGTVRLALTLRVRDTDGGSALTFTGTAAADGRITELPPAAVATALTRLLTRFGENLGAAAEQERPPETAESLATEDFAPAAAADFDAAPDADDAPVPAPADDSVPEGDTGHLADHASVFDTEVPPPSLDPAAQEDGDAGDPEEFAPVMEPPAEAAHARRTMIGRSAEEVDHAPPRGRYAPVPAPETVSAATSLRWAAPAAALVVASAIVVGRALRKRR